MELSECNVFFEADAVPSDTMDRFEKGTDFNEKWPGLNLNLLIDVYSVHKALSSDSLNSKITRKRSL